MTIVGGSGHPWGSLAWYVEELVARLAAGDLLAHARLRTVVGTRRARIGLEDEAVVVSFDRVGRFHAHPAPTEPGADEPIGAQPLDGEGRTTHAVVVALLEARLEVTDAILDGDIDVRGSADAVSAMIVAVDILIDAATRVPALRELADEYRSRHAAARRDRPPTGPPATGPRTSWPPVFADEAEDEMLRGLGLDVGERSSTMGSEPPT